MTTTTAIEKLFGQILDRKCHIINHAKQQADSYSQHLASKLLIDGITPPSWLWNPSSANPSSSDPKEFKKEELFSQLLLPHPQPAVVNRDGFCSLYNPPVVLEGKEEAEARVYGAARVPDERLHSDDRPAFISEDGNDIGPALNSSEQNVSATFLERQIDRSTSNLITETVNEEVPNGLPSEYLIPNGGYHAENNSTPLPGFNYNNVGCATAFASELDQSVISPQAQNEERISTSIPARDLSLSRLQRSKSRQKALELRRTVEKAVKSHQADTNVSGTCYNRESIVTNASNQLQHHQDSSLLASGAQGIGDCPSKDKDANVYSGRITRSRNASDLLLDDSKTKMDNSLYAAKVDSGRIIRSQNNSIEGAIDHVHLSNASSRRVTRSKCGPSAKSPLGEISSHEICHSQRAPVPEIIPCITSNNDVVEETAETDGLVESEVILVGPNESRATCSDSKLDTAGPSVALLGFDSRPASKSRMTVKPKALDFDEMGNVSLIKAITPMEEKENQDELFEKICEPAESPASLGKVTRSNCSKESMEKQSIGKEISNQITESWMDTNVTCLNNQAADDEHVIESTSKDVEDLSDVDGKIRNSLVLHGDQTNSPNAGGGISMLMYQEEAEIPLQDQLVQKCELGCNQMIRGDEIPVSSFIDNLNACLATSSRRLEVNEGNSSTLNSTLCPEEENQDIMILDRGVDEGLTSSGSVLLKEKSTAGDEGFAACDASKSFYLDGKDFTPNEIRQLKLLKDSSMQGIKFRSAAKNTWPQHKRRKIENFGGSSINRNLNSVGPNLRTALHFECIPTSHKKNAVQSDVSKSPNVQLHQNVLTQKTGLSPGMPIEQDGARGSFVTSSLSTGDAKEYEIGFGLNARTGEEASIFLDESSQVPERDYKDLMHLETDVSIQNLELDSYRTLLKTKPHAVEDGLRPSFLVGSPQDKYPDTIASDQLMPEFEGFIIGGEDSGQRLIDGDSFDHMNLPTSSVERASLLEQLCKSAVKHTPLYQFSATKKFHRTPDVYQSAPNGVLELLDQKITSNLNSDGFKQIGASDSSLDELEDASQGLYPDGIPFSDTGYAQSLNPPISPVSKLWGRISSQSFSSEKKLGSNPELTCFPIEEDPSISEEQEEKEEVANSSQEDAESASMDFGDKRDPLGDITLANIHPHPSESVVNKSQDSSSLESVDTEINFAGAHSEVKRKPGKRPSSKRINTHETKKKPTLSTSSNYTGYAKESLKNGLGQTNLARKTSLRKGGESVSGRKFKHNNIVSNISSFVPLVQQKQAAAVITGKRDVKVKALEAAEAAKRLEEKKENERKLKKEALKLEKARLEEEKLRQAEVKRKKKEEELKKKEADAAARKRLREEEEKKERERKRRRFEGKRQQQKEQEEKLRTRKLEKDLPVGVMDPKLNCEMGTLDASRKPQKVKVDENKGDGSNVKKSNTELLASKSLKTDVRQAILEGFGHPRVSTEATNTSRGKSYEISPYQSSDDDDDNDDDEISPNKFVPTWASKKSLALIVSSQNDIDPDILFPSDSFCSVDEIAGLGVYKKK